MPVHSDSAHQVFFIENCWKKRGQDVLLANLYMCMNYQSSSTNGTHRLQNRDQNTTTNAQDQL